MSFVHQKVSIGKPSYHSEALWENMLISQLGVGGRGQLGHSALPVLKAIKADVGRTTDTSDLLPPFPVSQLLVHQGLLHVFHG